LDVQSVLDVHETDFVCSRIVFVFSAEVSIAQFSGNFSRQFFLDERRVQ
jgi:hypothetical protein